MPVAETGADKIQISADGAMVPLLHGIWAEVKTLVVGEVQPVVEEKGEKVVHTRKLSYFSRKVSARSFNVWPWWRCTVAGWNSEGSSGDHGWGRLGTRIY